MSIVIVLYSLYIGQQLVLYLALLSCSLCSVKLHVVLLFVEQIKNEGKEGRSIWTLMTMILIDVVMVTLL